MNNDIILRNVSFGYSKDNLVLKDITLEIAQGSFLGIIGVNGSGKSTFTYLLNGIIPHLFKGYLQGEVLVDGISTKDKKVAYFAQKVGMLFQNPDFSLFNLTVAEEIAFGLKNLNPKGTPLNFAEKIKAALQDVGLAGYENRDPQTLSLGEKQKICLASVLAMDTKYIVLDEPVAMLDYRSSIEIYQILTRLQKQEKTIIVIEHDTDYLWQFADKVLLLDKATVLAYDDKKKIFSNHVLLDQLGIKVPRNMSNA